MNPWAEITGRATLWWMKNRPLSKEKRAYRKAKRQAKRKRRRGEALTAEEESVLSNQEDGMLEGKKTYLGIAAVAIGLVLGWFGIGECSSADVAAAVCVTSEALAAKLTAAINEVLTVGGLLLAAYGRAKAKPKA